MTRLKYMACAFKITDQMKRALEEVPRRGGFYNWIFLFKGAIRQFNYDLDFEKFDVININMSPVDQVLVQEVRKMIPKSSSTLLVLNNDYVAEAWSNWNQHPLQYLQTQELGDAVFSTEPHQVSLMRDDTYCIPHPHWIKNLKHIDVQYDHNVNDIGNMYHWWLGESHIESLMFFKLKKKYPKLFTKLYAYFGKDNSKRWQKVLFDTHKPLMAYDEFLKSLGKNKFLLENCHYHTYGRTTVDTAAIGVPTVGSNRIFSMKHCWPKMSFDPFDGKNIIATMEKIIKGGSWLDEQLDYAYEACEYFNYKNSKERFMTMIDETRTRLGK